MSYLWKLLFILLLLGADLIANANNNNDTNNDIDNENEEVCDQELIHITANYDKSFILCLETNESKRKIEGFRYNTYHKDTQEFIKGKTYNGDDLGLNDCTHTPSNEVSQKIPLANRDSQPSFSSAPQNELPQPVPEVEDNVNSDSCTSDYRIDITFKFNFALYLQSRSFSIYQGGDLYFSYLSSPTDRTYETLGLRLSRHDDNWSLTDLDNHRVTALDVDLNKRWYSGYIPFGINSMLPILYREEEEEDEEMKPAGDQ